MSLKLVPFKSLDAVSYLPSIVTMAVSVVNFVKMFDAGKTRMIGLLYGEKNYDDMLSRFHLIPERYGHTDRFAMSVSHVSMLMHDKN